MGDIQELFSSLPQNLYRQQNGQSKTERQEKVDIHFWRFLLSALKTMDARLGLTPCNLKNFSMLGIFKKETGLIVTAIGVPSSRWQNVSVRWNS